MDIEAHFTANINQEENGVDLAKYIINLGVCPVEQEEVDIETEITKSIKRRPAFVQKGIVDILQIHFTIFTVFVQVLWYIFHRRFHNESFSKRRTIHYPSFSFCLSWKLSPLENHRVECCYLELQFPIFIECHKCVINNVSSIFFLIITKQLEPIRLKD